MTRVKVDVARGLRVRVEGGRTSCPARAARAVRRRRGRRVAAPRRRGAAAGEEPRAGPSRAGRPSAAPAGPRGHALATCGTSVRRSPWRAMTQERIDARVRVVGMENVRRCHGQRPGRRPRRSATPGTGTSPARGAPGRSRRVTTVAERLKPEELFQEFVAFRESIGITIFALTGGGDVFRGLVRAAAEAQSSSRCSPTATSRPRASRSTCSGTGPGWRRVRPRWRSRRVHRW